MFKHLAPVNYADGTPGDFVASDSSLVLPRAAADTRGQCGAPHCAVQESAQSSSALCCARIADGGAGEEERRRDEGTGEGAKEVAVERSIRYIRVKL